MTTKEISNAPCTNTGDLVHESTGDGTEPQPRPYRNAAGQFDVWPTLAAERAEHLATVRAEIAAAEGLPATLRRLLQGELAMVLVALRECSGALHNGLLTRKNRLTAHYRSYLTLCERAAALVKLLGLDQPASGAGKTKAWSKMSREEQEIEAQKALDILHSEPVAGGANLVKRDSDLE